MRRTLSVFVALLVAVSVASDALAASNAEITVVPLGATVIKAGEQEISIPLPRGSQGPLNQPLVLLAMRPNKSGPEPTTQSTSQPAVEPEQPATPATYEQVPATLKFRIGDRALPDWELASTPTAYVINLDAIKSNPKYDSGWVRLTVTMNSEAKALGVDALGMPDPLLLRDGADAALNGPLADFARAAEDPDERLYFETLIKEISGEPDSAKAAYEKLTSAKDERVARFARRGLRMISYMARPHKLSGNYMEHYRWALYLEFCGFFDRAYREFEECRIIDITKMESQFRAGENLEHTSGDFKQIIQYMDRTGEAAQVHDVTIWHVLVTILKSRGGITLTQTQIDEVKNQWLFVERMVLAATRGNLRIATAFFEIDDEQKQPYKAYTDKLTAPDASLIETRGWFDSLISVRPRLENESLRDVAFAGPDIGPNGTAVASVYHDANWQAYLRAIYGHFAWAASVGEIEPGIPAPSDVFDCGRQPAPSEAHACRAAMWYHWSSDTFLRINIADTPVETTYLQLWRIEGPFSVSSEASSQQKPAKHVTLAESLSSPSAKAIEFVSENDFIDLKKIYPDAGAALARATTWVYSPSAQNVRLWLGQNDGAAVWLNGACIHTGQYYNDGEFTDKNMLDLICTGVHLEKGWNELQVVIENWPDKWSKDWGFSVSIRTQNGQAVPGLASVYRKPAENLAPRFQPPAVGPYYSWQAVKNDWRRKLPQLTDADLQKITGLANLSVIPAIQGVNGCVALAASNSPSGGRYRKLNAAWKPGEDRDIAVNNVMDWGREGCAALRYKSGDAVHDLLIVRPEHIETFTTVLKESKSAESLFKKMKTADRILGYVTISESQNLSTRTLLVIDTLLGDESGWPTDEEDLLTPFGEFIPNWTEEKIEGPPKPKEEQGNSTPTGDTAQ